MTTLNSTLASSPLDPRIETLTPTVNTDFTLPSTGIKAGQRVIMLNNGANSGNYPIVTLKASDASVVRQVYPTTSGEVVALQDNPTTTAHWAGVGIVSSPWMAYTPLITGSTSNPTLGAGAQNTGFWKRNGDSAIVRWDFLQTAGGTAGSGSHQIGCPVGVSASSAAVNNGGNGAIGICGYGGVSTGGTTPSMQGAAKVTGANGAQTYVFLWLGKISATATDWVEWGSASAINFSSSTVRASFQVEFPVFGWTPTKG